MGAGRGGGEGFSAAAHTAMRNCRPLLSVQQCVRVTHPETCESAGHANSLPLNPVINSNGLRCLVHKMHCFRDCLHAVRSQITLHVETQVVHRLFSQCLQSGASCLHLKHKSCFELWPSAHCNRWTVSFSLPPPSLFLLLFFGNLN